MSERRDKKQVLIPAKPRADEWVAQGREKTTAPEQKMKRLTLDLPEGLHGVFCPSPQKGIARQCTLV